MKIMLQLTLLKCADGCIKNIIICNCYFTQINVFIGTLLTVHSIFPMKVDLNIFCVFQKCAHPTIRMSKIWFNRENK